MRYHSSQAMATDMSSSVQSWLGQELDSRGIDANIYSRYVLSILQHEGSESVEIQDQSPPPLVQSKKSVSSVTSAANVAALHGKSKARTKKTEKRKSEGLSVDEVRKTAAIECLLSVTDEKSGIETLVEELILKLKEIQNAEAVRISPKKVLHEIQLQSTDSKQHTEDPVEKYYAAFPSLSVKCEELKPKLVHRTPDDKIWAHVASTKAEEDDTHVDKKSAISPQLQSQHSCKKDECSAPGHRKHIKSPPKEEKERQNLASKQRSRSQHMSPRLYSTDSGSNKKRSPRSKISPNNRYYKYNTKGRAPDTIKGRAILQNNNSNKETQSKWFTEFHPPSFVVPKITPKKCFKYRGRIEDRSHSEEKIHSRPLLLYRCHSDCIHNEDYHAEGDPKSAISRDILDAELQCLMESVEDLIWYTKPLDDIIDDFIMPSPVPKQRLYERNASEVDEMSSPFSKENEFKDNSSSAEKSLIKSKVTKAKRPHKTSATSTQSQNKRHYSEPTKLSSLQEQLLSKRKAQCQEEKKSNEQFLAENDVSSDSSDHSEVEDSICSSPMEEFEFPTFKPVISKVHSVKHKEHDAANEVETFVEDCKTLFFKEPDEESDVKNKGVGISSTSDLVFVEDYFDSLSRESSCGNLCDVFSYGGVGEFSFVPPNTPVHLQDQHVDALGLSSLVQLAEQMKTISQDSDGDVLLRLVSQEESPEDKVDESFIGDDINDQDAQDCVCDLKPGSGIQYMINSNDESPVPEDFISLFEVLGEGENTVHTGIPTPLSTCSPGVDAVSDTEKHNCSSPAFSQSSEDHDYDTNKLSIFLPGEECVINQEGQSEVTIVNDQSEFDDSGMIDEHNISQYAASLGHQDVFKQLDLNSSGDSGSSCLRIDQLDQDLVKQLDLDSSGSESDDESSDVGKSCESPSAEKHSINNNSWYKLKTMNNNNVGDLDQNDVETAQYSKINKCERTSPEVSHLVWWNFSEKPNIWSYDSLASSTSITYDMTSAVWKDSHMSSLWGNSSLSLKKSFTSRPSPLREFFSPWFQEESRIWDINMQMLDFSSPFEHQVSSQFSPPSLFGHHLTFSSSGLHMTYIEGGLYGNEWDLLLEGPGSDITTRVLENSDWSNSIPEQTLINSSPSDWALKPPPIFRQRSHSDEYCLHALESSPNSPAVPSKRTDLLQSENSAFTDVSRSEYSGSECSESPVFSNVPIHHVQSEPILSPDRSGRIQNMWVTREAHYRMIEVKHLYKSDTSILRQLGLASGTDAEETDQSDSIEYSPDRHFVPIKTPQGSIDRVTSPTETVISDTVTVIPDDSLTEKGSLEGSWSGSFKSTSRSSSYQLYKDKDPEEDDVYFIPRFKVEKQFEKCMQTGDSPVVLPSAISSIEEVDEDHDQALTERLLTDMKHVLELTDDKQLTIAELNDSIQHQDVDLAISDYESVGHDTSGDDYPGPAGIATLWEEPGEGGSGMVVYNQSIWRCGLNTSIPLAPVTPSTTKSCATPTSSSLPRQDSQDDLLDVYAAAIDNFEDYIYKDWSTNDHGCKNYYQQNMEPESWSRNITADQSESVDWSHDPSVGHPWAHENQDPCYLHDAHSDQSKTMAWSNHTDVKSESVIWSHDHGTEQSDINHWSHLHHYSDGSGHEAEPEWMHEVVDDVYIDSDEMMFLMDAHVPPDPPPPPPLPESLGVFSSDLERKWLSDQSQFSTQTPEQRKLRIHRKKGKEPYGNKPCSFFLEGSCRRADCKFAHDMSAITCKFWEDGECFKGTTCPFLHGYYKRRLRSLPHSIKKSKKSEFKLEKEDFPELLSNSQEEYSDQSNSSGSVEPTKAKSEIPLQNLKRKSLPKAAATSRPTIKIVDCTINKPPTPESLKDINSKPDSRKSLPNENEKLTSSNIKKKSCKVNVQSLPIDIKLKALS